MMDETKKIVIAVLVLLVLLAGILAVALVDVPVLGTLSVKSIIGKRQELITKEAELIKEQNTYDTKLIKLEDTKTSYGTEKTKYEAISDETIKIIQEANTLENYSLEYMWIRLGNYAKRNNLTFIMVEPNNDPILENNEIDEENEDKSVVEEDKTSESNEEDIVNDTAVGNGEALKIQVTGSYLDLADFIFEVENDSELRFKLDNISMELVSGTVVRATFDVKNIIINK